MIDAIGKLLGRRETGEVKQLSLLLNDIEISLDTNILSEQEYVELMVDVERLKKIIELKGDLELNKLIHDAVVGLIELAKAVKP